MKKYCEIAKKLRKELHNCPEKSMEEVKTKKLMMEFLKDSCLEVVDQDNCLEMVDQGNWFYARWMPHPEEGAICFRGDYDAVTDGDGISRHLCGHDGHASTLAAFGKWICDHKPDRNIILLFQPGEESGEGGAVCRKLFDLERVDEIYGFHNIPGKPLGEVLLKKGTFACASTGLAITFIGATTHAAYPEDGINPAQAVARLVLAVEDYVKAPHQGIVLSTVIGIDLGSSSYGVSASEGTLRLTVRAEFYDEFVGFLDYLKKMADELALEYGLKVVLDEIEAFPSTENHEECVKRLEEAAVAQGLSYHYLDQPMRWSEDFGWYLQEVKGAFFGVGAGVDWAPLHTEFYEYNDELTENVLKMYIGLV